VKPGGLFLFALVALPALGWILLTHPSYGHFRWICRLALSGATGAVLLSLWMTAFALVGIAWHFLPLVVLTLLTSLLLRTFLKVESPAQSVPPEKAKLGIVEKLAVLLTVLALLWAWAAAASSAATSPDLLFFWGTKAQAFAAARTVDASFLRKPLLQYLHPSYPPLVTNIYAVAAMAAGRFPWEAATLTFPLLLTALAMSLPGLLRLSVPRDSAWASSALIITALGFLGNELDVAGNGEPFLWLFETLSMAILISPFGLTRGGKLLAGLFLAGAAVSKVEGLPFTLAAVVLLLLLTRREDLQIGNVLVPLLLPAALSLGVWFVFGAVRHVFFGYESYGQTLDIHWDRLSLVLGGVGAAIWSSGFALPFLLPLLAVIAAPGKSRLALLPIGVSLTLALFFVFTYLHGDKDPSEWIGWSAGRVLSPIAALLAVASLARRRAGTPAPLGG